MKKKPKSDRKVKVTDLETNTQNPKGGTYQTIKFDSIADGSVRTVTTELKANKN